MEVVGESVLPWADLFSTRGRRIKSSAIRELLKVTEQPDFISFAGGFPAPELFPVEAIAETIQDVMNKMGPQALQYSATEGYRPLRQWVADYMRAVGVPAVVENVLITTGSQQALDLLGRVLINKDDPVAVETPTYLAALQAWRVYGASFLGIPTDTSGINPDYLENNLLKKPKLLYSIPNFQNPTGATLPLDRRHALVDWCRKERVCLIEDDPYREIRFEGKFLPRLIELEAQAREEEDVYRGQVVYLSTFSKVLAPGLRVGAVIAHPELLTRLVQAKQAADLHTPTLNQMVCYELAKEGFLKDQARKVAEVYKVRRDVMIEEIRRVFPEGTEVGVPEGGMFLWLTLPTGIDADQIWEKALEQKIAFVPGAPFYPEHPKKNTLRLNFSNSDPDTSREGMAGLGRALDSLK
ncbi:MAG: PLP-dependent aminotransferase family protein [Candidatus Eremiobacteraeota bacterium]|nr:PLP-dependent aminotransferase family protein [Candidatus Eremiobacteraeota bacterium]